MGICWFIVDLSFATYLDKYLTVLHPPPPRLFALLAPSKIAHFYSSLTTLPLPHTSPIGHNEPLFINLPT